MRIARGPGQHRAGMHGRGLGSHHIAGRRTMKRAPSTWGAPPSAAGGEAIFDPQPPIMGFDDLLGDREAKPGILAEALVRAGRCRSAGKILSCASAHTPGPIVVDHDLDLLLEPAAGDPQHCRGAAENEAGVVDQIIDHLAEGGNHFRASPMCAGCPRI